MVGRANLIPAPERNGPRTCVPSAPPQGEARGRSTAHAVQSHTGNRKASRRMDSQNRPGAWKDPGEEAALVSRAQRGDRAAFLTLLRYYDRSVHRIIYALVRDPEQAATLTHSAFVRAWSSMKNIPAGQNFYPWLTRLARGLAITQARRGPVPIEPGVRDLPGFDAAAEASGDPTDAERAARCERAFSDLNIDQQTILVLRVAERL